MDKKKHFSTSLIHGESSENSYGAVVQPIINTTTFYRDEEGGFPNGRDIYTRSSNPNRSYLENKLALLESATAAVCFSSGQAASMSIFHALGAGSHVILPDDIYFGTKVLLEKLFNHWGTTFSEVDMTDLHQIVASIQENTSLIWIETPSNPLLKITDIESVVKIAKERNILTACDNTWATPFFCSPLLLGVDIVMHSTTKYLAGHSDVLGGVVLKSDQLSNDFFQKIRDFQTLGGAVPSPFDCWLLNRSLATFHVRMPLHAQNALELALKLKENPKVLKVFYPGLPSHPQHLLALKQMKNGFGGMLSILLDGNEAECLKIASKLRIFKHATSLGGVESLVDHRKTAEGIASKSPENLLRISVGLEYIQDLIEDFEQALA
jgi:cystathionine gamma-synthase